MKVRFPAMQAMIGNHKYYSTTMALSEVPRFFKFNDWEQVDPAQRAQRVLNTSRVPEITKYILDNEDSYIFSSITASYNCPVTFTPSDPDERIGFLEMDLEQMEFIINDGQHRTAAITAALKENPEIGKERISVLLFEMENLNRLQQMFSDLNRFVHRTSKSLNILYDHRDTLSTLTMDITEQVPVFQGMVEKEKTAIPLRSPKLFTLSALYDANGELLGSAVEKAKDQEYDDLLSTATAYWVEVSNNMLDWQQAKRGDVPTPQLRQEKINTHGVILRALGGVGRVLIEQYPSSWPDQLRRLQEIDWRKSVGSKVNPMWDNVCIVAGSVVSNRQARVATQAVLKYCLDLSLSNAEKQIITNLSSMGWNVAKTEQPQSNGRR